MKNKQTIIVIAIAVLVLAIGSLTWFQISGTSSNSGKTGTSTLIGGPFTLKDHDGKQVTEKTFFGKYMLIYFGYTFCPDVCPTELQKMTTALELLDKSITDKLTPVFVSVDPARDDKPGVMKDYVANFFPGMVGLTGTPEQIAAITKAYRVYFRIVKEKGDDSDDYSVDHSSIIYLMGPDGRFVKHFSNGTTAEVMAQTLKKIIGG